MAWHDHQPQDCMCMGNQFTNTGSLLVAALIRTPPPPQIQNDPNKLVKLPYQGERRQPPLLSSGATTARFPARKAGCPVSDII